MSEHRRRSKLHENAPAIVAILQDRLHACNDLHLTLKHIHWNVVGPEFIAVHTMLDPQVAAVREQADVLAERIATLGGVPVGTPGALVASRSWSDYALGRATTQEHLAALAEVYAGVIDSHREAVEKLGELDPATEDIVLSQVEQLELFDWFVRAHLEGSDLAASGRGTSASTTANDTETHSSPLVAGHPGQGDLHRVPDDLSSLGQDSPTPAPSSGSRPE